MNATRKLIFSIIFFIGFNGGSLFAQTTAATPTLISGVYQVSTLSNLLWIMENKTSWSSNFILTADIDASGTQYWDAIDDNSDGNNYNDSDDGPSGAGNNDGWKGIGNNTDRFTGSFDGDDFTISGLSMYRSNEFVGLFGSIQNARIYDLKLTTISYEVWGGKVGGLSGDVRGSSSVIENIYVQGDIIVNNSGSDNVGGIVGQASEITISDVHFKGSITASSSYVGGVIGYSEDPQNLDNLYSEATIEGVNFVGGILGVYNCTDSSSAATINSCLFKGSLEGDTAGGIIGYMGPSDKIPSGWKSQYNVVNANIITGTKAGGIVGDIAVSNVNFECSIVNLELDDYTLSNQDAFVGFTSNPISFTNNYYNQDISGLANNNTGVPENRSALITF